jgi:uncharacterized metal-binding protein
MRYVMKYVLIKYKEIKMLVNEGLSMQPLIENLIQIEALNKKVIQFHANLLNATSEQGKVLQKEVTELTSKIGYKIIGVPFTNHDAELYALDKKLDYAVLELHGNTGKSNAAKDDGKNATVQFRTLMINKTTWVKAAQKYKKDNDLKKFSLTDWIEMKLNG